MNAQAVITAYPAGMEWCIDHPRATDYIIQRARCDNAKGRKARLQQFIEEMRLTPADFDLTAERNGTYGFDHRLRSEVARYIAEQYSCEFAIRKASCDAGATQATPRVGSTDEA